MKAMNVLMFGWEFPPHISGGLGTACYGITKAISAHPGIRLTFVIPKSWGDEPTENIKLIGASDIDLIKSKIKIERFTNPHTFLSIQSKLTPYIDPGQYQKSSESAVKAGQPAVAKIPESVKFTGQYNSGLMAEIHNFSVVAEHLATQGTYDIIHAHDWLTFPAGILAKKATGKPLVVHVHATDFDRSGGKANPDVYNIEKAGMDSADKIITVSDHTGNIVNRKYSIHSSRLVTIHNGVDPVQWKKISRRKKNKRTKIVTFLGRITIQKGPRYFVEVAEKVLSHCSNVEFVMAGSGDLLLPMMEMVKKSSIADKFHFPGFLKGNDVTRLLHMSDVYIMPSVSEPFGITPLEAMYCRVPVIISKQSGVSETIRHAITADFWDTDVMADAVYNLLKRPALKKMMVSKAAAEVKKITWEDTAAKIISVYEQFLRA